MRFADYESMYLSSVLWVWMCVFLYIQNSEAAIRGFLPKNTDVEKTERAQEIFDSTHRLTDRTRKFMFNSLSLCSSHFILWVSFDSESWISLLKHWLQRAQWPTDGATTVQNPKGQVCHWEHVLQVTNVTSLGGVTTKFDAPFLLQWLDSANYLSDSVRTSDEPAVVDGKRPVKKLWSISLFFSPCRGAWQTIF